MVKIKKQHPEIIDLAPWGMTDREKRVWKWLWYRGMEPERIFSHASMPENLSMPDIKCKDNIYVEVKKIPGVSFNYGQINKFNDLVKAGSKVYILIVDEERKKWYMHRYMPMRCVKVIDIGDMYIDKE